MQARTLRRLFVALVVFEWLAFGLFGVLFVRDCCVLNPAGAIGGLIGAIGLFVFNMLTWPGNKRALDKLKQYEDEDAEPAADYESYEVSEGRES